MNKDVFYEYMVQKKITVLDWIKVISAGIGALAVTLAVLLLFLNGITLGGMFLLIIFLVWWGFIVLVRNMKIEYEYAVTNNELDIDIIKGRSRRKHITTINLKSIDFFANKNDVRIADKIKDQIKEYYLVSDKKSENIFVTEVLSRKNNMRIRVYLEADEELVKAVEAANPKAVNFPGSMPR